MSVILKFNTELSRRPRRPLEEGEPRGAILFFTGVRIERHVEADPAERRGRLQGRRRKA